MGACRRSGLVPWSSASGSSHSDAGLAWAFARAELVSLLTVHAAGALSVGELIGGAAESAELRRAAEHPVTDEALGLACRMAPGLRIGAATPVRDAREVLLDLSSEAAMVIVGTRGHGPVTSLLFGSVSLAVGSHAPGVALGPGQRSGTMRRHERALAEALAGLGDGFPGRPGEPSHARGASRGCPGRVVAIRGLRRGGVAA